MHPKATKPRGPPAIHSILARVPLDADACGVVPAQTDFPHRVIEPRELRRGRVLLVPLRTLAVPVEAPHHKSTLARDRGRVVRPRRDQGDPVAQRVGLQPVDDARLVAAHFFPMPQLAEVATAPTGHIATLKDGEAMFGPRRQAPHLSGPQKTHHTIGQLVRCRNVSKRSCGGGERLGTCRGRPMVFALGCGTCCP
eukprot:scaffold680_cov264-Pinguiococcus_pyrenoidosus.AAC.16